jgi:pimeloyl-ACP methyl ester carboxylesterase
VLGSFATDGAALGDLAADRVLALSAFYGWDEDARALYLARSIQQWNRWQSTGASSVATMGRRVSLEPLAAWAAIDLYDTLSQVSVPVLVLHGAEDTWVPVDGAQRLLASLRTSGDSDYAFHIMDGMGHDLGRSADSLWDDAVDATVWDWVQSLPASGS